MLFSRKSNCFCPHRSLLNNFWWDFPRKVYQQLLNRSRKSLSHILSIFILLSSSVLVAKVVAVVAAAGSVDSGRRRRVLSNYSALSLYSGNKGKTKPHDASNTREQFESSLGTGFYGSLSLNPRLATSNCFWQIGRRRGIKDDCFNLQLKRGKIWTDRE